MPPRCWSGISPAGLAARARCRFARDARLWRFFSGPSPKTAARKASSCPRTPVSPCPARLRARVSWRTRSTCRPRRWISISTTKRTRRRRRFSRPSRPACSAFRLTWRAWSARRRATAFFLIEDAAQTMGAMIDGRAAGSFGDASLLSFGRGKPVGGQGGGVLIAHTRAVAEMLTKLRQAPARRSRFASGASAAAAWLSIRPEFFCDRPPSSVRDARRVGFRSGF
ncbi:MAG: DegT/DnrJ/EryC1/StrS family aminotransferase [Deltaproteobacteria bacterium]|nr:DegT/DnrJ/EryC1/StrS family aminotransferase [Deltaproteobacteria bacterium]